MELRVLHQHGWSISALARKFGLSRNTVKRELESAEPRRYPAREKPTMLTDAQRAHVERRLAVCPTMLGQHGRIVMNPDKRHDRARPFSSPGTRPGTVVRAIHVSACSADPAFARESSAIKQWGSGE